MKKIKMGVPDWPLVEHIWREGKKQVMDNFPLVLSLLLCVLLLFVHCDFVPRGGLVRPPCEALKTSSPPGCSGMTWLLYSQFT